MADLGYIVLVLALLVSLFSAVTYFVSGRQERQSRSARGSLILTFGLISMAVGVLLYAIFAHNFQLEYVASYTSRDTSIPYLFSAWWAGNNGSLLFWAWVLSLFAMVLVLRKRGASRELVPYAASIVMFTEAFFLILLVSVCNPFQKVAVVPPDGMGLNPLLENPGMIFHPAALLAGYVGFTIPFALAMAALLTRRLGSEWTVAARRWTLLPWLLLGVGNIIGAWWAYVELGWGGYWAWDPVENAGLMPWLVATAFLHSTMVQRRRGMFKVWNMLLIILAFTLTIFGTFLTRSNLLSSVHTFGDLGLGPFFLVFIAISLLGSLLLLYYRREDLKSEAEVDSLVSRESAFLLNNLLLVGSAVVVFIGTVFPAISEAVRGVKITVGAPFFNMVNGPIFLTVILLAGICAAIGWQRKSMKSLGRNLLWPLVAAVIVGLVLFVAGVRQGYAISAFTLCSFVLFMVLSVWLRETRERHQARSEDYLTAFWRLLSGNRPRYGGYIIHIAVILMAIGVIGSSFFGTQKEVMLKMGESMTINNYTLTYDDIGHGGTQTRFIVTATLSVRNGDKLIGKVTPEKLWRFNPETNKPLYDPVSEVAIRSTLAEDLYVILVGWDQSGSTAFKVLVNPLVDWIWVGGGVFLVGGLIAFWPDRRRRLVTTGVGDLEDVRDEDVEKQVTKLRQGKGHFCAKCGTRYEEGDRFCSRCGARLKQVTRR